MTVEIIKLRRESHIKRWNEVREAIEDEAGHEMHSTEAFMRALEQFDADEM